MPNSFFHVTFFFSEVPFPHAFAIHSIYLSSVKEFSCVELHRMGGMEESRSELDGVAMEMP
jgi:hypothetical protein